MSHFKLLAETKASDVVPVKKFISEKTGLTVVIANLEGPVVNGYFGLATEAHDDDGLPHTLEHLIFLGSERYPYKGILDLLANRCLADGTNAWTDTDHTCYTIRTAGSEGILTLLPIYLDHILNPLLTDHGFITEVHHIDGDGQDAGVVYCEMQGRENLGDSRCHLELLRAAYPNNGYSAETGGIMANLRISTTNEKVKQYHREFYRPENLTIVLTGMVEPEQVFKALEPVEEDILKKKASRELPPWTRPWQTFPPPPATLGQVVNVEWPADTEDCGQVLLGWRGPSLLQDNAIKDLTGCAVLIRYMCETLVAPLQRDLVEKEDALAGDIAFNIQENLSPLLMIALANVPVNKLAQAHSEALKTLSKLRSGEEPLDTVRLQRLLKKQLMESISELESGPHSSIAMRLLGDMLFSTDTQGFKDRLNPQNILRQLQKEPAEYWHELLRTNFSDQFITVIGKPSIALQHKMEEEEMHRIEKQKDSLGEDGLSEKTRQLYEAMQYNAREPPSGVLTSVPVPSSCNLRTHDIKTWSSDEGVCPHFDLKKMPIYTRLHSLHTNFVYLTILADTSHLSNEHRRWLPILLDSFGEATIERDGKLISPEIVASEIEEYTLELQTTIGFDRGDNFSIGSFGNSPKISLQCDPIDYEKVVTLLYEMIYQVKLEKERLLITAQKLINEVAQTRRKGPAMTNDLLKDYLYKENTNVHWCTALRQLQFLNKLVERLNSDQGEAVVNEALQAREELFKHIWLHAAADLERYKLSEEPWSQFSKNTSLRKPQISSDETSMHENLPNKGFLVGVGGLETNYLVSAWNGPTHLHSDFAPLLLANNYFTQLEGPMWRLIRGGGLSYGYGLNVSVSEAKVLLSMYRATNVVAAYSKADSILEEFLSSGSFEEHLFCSARSSTIFEIVDKENCPKDVVFQSLVNYFKGVGPFYNRELVEAVSSSSAEEAGAAARRWLSARKEANIVVVSHPSRVQQTWEAFHKIGVELEAFESIESTHLNK